MDKPKGKILVVDDEESMRRILCRCLETECYDCVTAASGQEALDKAAAQGFDVVLLDILMPGLSGIEVLPKLVTCYPNIQVIMVTSEIHLDMIMEALKLGAFDYVTKPFNVSDLIARVEKAIEKKRTLEA